MAVNFLKLNTKYFGIGTVGSNVRVGKHVLLSGRKNIVLGDNVLLGNGQTKTN